jgi:hypothetical protein
MDTKEAKVECPCCQSRLEIDVRTGTVLRWRKKGETDELGKPVLREGDWSSASQRVNERLGSAAEKFDESLTREKAREKDLDELFRKASQKHPRKEGE